MDLQCSLEELYRGTTRRMKIRCALCCAALCYAALLLCPYCCLLRFDCVGQLAAGSLDGRLPEFEAPLQAFGSWRCATSLPACCFATAAHSPAFVPLARRSRKRLDANGQQRPDSEMLEIHVRPGWKAGTKITFQEKGEQGALLRSQLTCVPQLFEA